MTSFWDLPKDVRQRIYRLHLVQHSPVRIEDYMESCGARQQYIGNIRYIQRGKITRMMPCLLEASPQLEREAVDVYFGENIFKVESPRDIGIWFRITWKRHHTRIRKLHWRPPSQRCTDASGDRALRRLERLPRLEELEVQMDELKSVSGLLRFYPPLLRHSSLGYGQQIQLQLMRHDGIHGLRALRGIKKLTITSQSEEDTIPGGMLETIGSEIMQPRGLTHYEPEGHFRFLDLPAEIRNIVYRLLLVNTGPTYPSNDIPVSVAYTLYTKRRKTEDQASVPPSTLELLCVNRQIHNEAYGIFYHDNELVFNNAVHLQTFALSLGNERLDSLRSAILFCGQSKSDHPIDATLQLLRLLKGLEKLHLLVSPDSWEFLPNDRFSYQARIADLPGLATLSSFRKLKDTKVSPSEG